MNKYIVSLTFTYLFVMMKIDRKSQKLTNILLFIIVCFIVLGALCALGRMAFTHRGFEWRGCMMQWQEENGKSCELWTEKWACPYADDKVDVVNNTTE
jgi:hypothetical protein